MTRWSLIALTTLVSLSVVVPALADAGELRRGASLVSGMAGYTNHESEQSGDRLGGGSWSFDYARMSRSSKWSAGVLLRRFEGDETFDSAAAGNEIRINAKRLLVGAQGRFYFANERFSPYVGTLLGVHMQTSDVYEEGESDFRRSNQTLALGFFTGTTINLTGGIFARAEYALHYFAGSDTIKNNHMHAFYAGLGFQFGGQ
jgi:opacity protein-like surface antigen